MLAPRLQQISLVVFVAAIVMLTNLGGPRLWDRDEPRNAGCAREMFFRGDWIVPTFNAEAEGVTVDEIIKKILDSTPRGDSKKVL